MIEANNKVMYKAFGLNILSDFKLPELLKGKHTDKVDIMIEKENLYQKKPSNIFLIDGGKVLFYVPGTAIFSIIEGKKILVSPIEESDENKIRLYLLGTCMAILLMQRKTLPLHGSAVVINNKAYAFVGERGAGKSTIAAAFLRKGYTMITDDIISVQFGFDNFPYAIPSYPQQKLWEESLNKLEMDTDNYKPLFERETKFAVPIIHKYHSSPLPLAGVFELVKTDNDDITIRLIPRLERLHTLYTHTFRQFLLNELGLRQWHFEITAGLIDQIDLFQLHRSTTTFTADMLVELVLETIKKGELTHGGNQETLVEQ